MRKLTQDEFITKAKEIHGDIYDYSKTVYTKSKDNLTITCNKHGDFEQTANSHLAGRGCNQCAVEYRADLERSTKDEYVIKANKVHENFYAYSKLVYKDVHTKSTITCPIHGDFDQKLNCHLRGQGCPECGKRKAGNSRSFFKGKPTILYVIKFNDSCYKVGVTSKPTVEKRYYGDTKAAYEVVFQVSFFDGSIAYSLEQEIVKEFAIYNYVGEPVLKRTKNHEVFTYNPTDRVKTLILKLISPCSKELLQQTH